MILLDLGLLLLLSLSFIKFLLLAIYELFLHLKNKKFLLVADSVTIPSPYVSYVTWNSVPSL